ncbi:MAG: hypothetical protein JW806_02070 [Sedimentisphaerales bacterium]|nr:hypothetical protein [Sedimentisphaerales bacterium]
MIFALIDYLKYKNQKGIYGLESIHKYNAVLAEPSLLPKLEKCKPGDILFVHTAGSIMSWAVMYYTGPGIWSHCATFGKEGYLYDCTTQGVIERHISDYFDGKSYIAVMSIGNKLPDKQRKKMTLRAEQILGAGFDWKGIFFFWLSIISGNNEDFRVCCVADIIILIVSLMGIFYKILILRYVFLALGVLYLLVVVFSRVRMKIFKRERVEYPDTKEAKKEYVVGKNIIDDLIELSLEDLEKYFGLFEKDFADIPEAVIAACNNVANKLVKIDEFAKAEMLYKKALKYCKTSTPKGKMGVAGILNNLAGIYVERKQYDKAKKTIREAIGLIENLDTNEAEIFYARLQENINLLNRRINRE